MYNIGLISHLINMVLIFLGYQVLNYLIELDFELKFRSSNWF